MDLLQAVKERHSVRAYSTQPIEAEKLNALFALVEEINNKNNLSIVLKANEPNAFKSKFFHYGKFKNVNNYFALIGEKRKGIEQELGYFGEYLVLEAQRLGLNTCWVALTYNRGFVKKLVGKNQKLVCVIALGVGSSNGSTHKSKSIEEVTDTKNAPDWFWNGINCALLAPTALNHQRFKINLLESGKVKLISLGGACSSIDLGIVKLHFEIGAGIKVDWQE